MVEYGLIVVIVKFVLVLTIGNRGIEFIKQQFKGVQNG